jgi:hypothetical protein
MPTIIDTDVDVVFYEFAAQGSLHYGLLMLKQAEAEFASGGPDDLAKADALARHAKDYMRGAAQAVCLLVNSYPGVADFEDPPIQRAAAEGMANANDLRERIEKVVAKCATDIDEWTAKADVRWMALLSNRSFSK